MIAAPFVAWAGLDNSFHSPLFTSESSPRGVLVLPDDSFLAFNSFTRLSGVAVGPIVKFNANGSRDQIFRFPDGYFSITAAAPTSDGHLIVAAAQQDKAGREFNRILKLNPDGSIDGSVNSGSGADDEIFSVALQADGKILVGGLFAGFNQTTRQGFLRLNQNGSIDTTFAPLSFTKTETQRALVVGVLASILVQADGKCIIGGPFSAVNGVAADGVARLNSDGSVDTTFTASGFINSRLVRDLALEADGRILVAGAFYDPADLSPGRRRPLVRLHVNGSLERFFQPPDWTSTSRTIEILPNGEILFADSYLFRSYSDGNLLPGYPTAPFSTTDYDLFVLARDIDAQSSGSFLVAGPELVNGIRRSGLARFQANGSLDPFNAGEFEAEVLAEKAATAADGKIYLSGKFGWIDGIARSGFARLQSSGILDSGYDLARTLGFYKTTGFLVQPDGKLLVSGWTYDETYGPIFGLNRITASGQIDSSFNTDFYDDYDQTSADIVVAPDGSYLAFEPYCARSVYDQAALVRLTANGSTDSEFRRSLPRDTLVYEVEDEVGLWLARVFAGETKPLAFLAQGKFLAKYFDKTGNYHLVRVNKDGTIDSSFQRGTVRALQTFETVDFVGLPHPIDPFRPTPVTVAPGAPLSDVAVLSDGKIIVVGMFTDYNGTTAPGIVRLLSNGQIDGTFTPGGGAQWTTTQVDGTHVPQIDSIELQANGQLLITGNFEAYDGVPAPGIALLHPNGKPDMTFSAPVTLQDFGPFEQFPASKLYREKAGSYLLTGRYAKTGETNARSLVRIETPVPTSGDFSGDTFADYLLFQPTTRATAIWKLHGNAFSGGIFGPTLPAGWIVACIADLNLDASPDYVLFNASTRLTVVWFLNNGTFRGSAFGPILPAGWTLIGAEDVNNDGTPDYVIFNPSTRQTAFWFLNGVALLGSVLGPTIPAGWSLIDAVDFNDNGRTDFLLSKSSTRQTAIWYLNGPAFVSSAFGPTPPSGWSLQGASDFNGDAKPDYVLFQASTRRTAIWYLNGGAFTGSANGPTLAAGYNLVFP